MAIGEITPLSLRTFCSQPAGSGVEQARSISRPDVVGGD